MAAKSANYTTQQLIDYIVAGGNISDLVGSNVSQSGILSKLLSDPRLLSTLGQQVATSGGASFDPNQTYTTAAIPFEAANNSVRLKYSQRSPVEQQIANMVFDTIDQGKDPIKTITAIDDSFLKPYGVTRNDVAGLVADLSKDAPKYVDAKVAQNTALQKQQYNAFVKQTGGTGTGTGALANRLGVPTLANLPNPTGTYGSSLAELNQNPIVTAALTKINARYGNTKYVPTAAEMSQARSQSANAFDPNQGDPTTNQINQFFGTGGEQTRAYVPESILGNKQLGTRAVNEIIGTGLAGLTKLAGGFFTGGGYNPFSKGKPKAEADTANAAARQKAYESALSGSSGAYEQNKINNERDMLLRRAAEIINERGQKMAGAGITPFTVAAGNLVPMLAQTKTKIKKK
jgi:hypothetical protein